MDFIWELAHDETVRAIFGWVGALGVVALWVWIARVMVGRNVTHFNREQAEREAKERAAEAEEARKG
jgi:hypothetical protein